MALRDVLAGEDRDNREAASAAASGRSLTGLSGRHTDRDAQFADRDAVFGGSADPLVGPKVEPIRMAPMGDGIGISESDPLYRAQRPSAKPRIPFGAQEQALAYPKRPGYRRYWFSDLPGRIRRALEAGYSHVRDPETGDNVNRITDKADGRGRSSYLMETPIQWYQEDMARQAADLDRRLHDIRQGKAGPGADDNRYIPEQGITIRRV